MTAPGKTFVSLNHDLLSTLSAELDKSRSVTILRKRLAEPPARRRKAVWRNPLRVWCRDHAVTQRQLAQRLGYSSRGSMMSQLINGRRVFSVKQLAKCHEVTGIPTDDLIDIHKHAAHAKRRPGPRHRRQPA